jgi:hypothetical protein
MLEWESLPVTTMHTFLTYVCLSSPTSFLLSVSYYFQVSISKERHKVSIYFLFIKSINSFIWKLFAGCQSHKLVACRTYKCYICASLFLCHWGACQCLSPASWPFNGNVRTRPIHERNNDREIGRRPAFYVGRKWNHAWSVTNSVLSPIRRQSIAFIHNQRPPWPCVKSPSTMHGTKTHSA